MPKGKMILDGTVHQSVLNEFTGNLFNKYYENVLHHTTTTERNATCSCRRFEARRDWKKRIHSSDLFHFFYFRVIVISLNQTYPKVGETQDASASKKAPR